MYLRMYDCLLFHSLMTSFLNQLMIDFLSNLLLVHSFRAISCKPRPVPNPVKLASTPTVILDLIGTTSPGFKNTRG